MLDNAKDVGSKKIVRPAARRDAVAHLRITFELSKRGASTAAPGGDRMSHRYRSCRPDDAAARLRLREQAGIRRRFGYRRLLVLMSREA